MKHNNLLTSFTRYQNVNIKGNNMSFDAADGVVKLIRIK